MWPFWGPGVETGSPPVASMAAGAAGVRPPTPAPFEAGASGAANKKAQKLSGRLPHSRLFELPSLHLLLILLLTSLVIWACPPTLFGWPTRRRRRRRQTTTTNDDDDVLGLGCTLGALAPPAAEVDQVLAERLRALLQRLCLFPALLTFAHVAARRRRSNPRRGAPTRRGRPPSGGHSPRLLRNAE